MSTNNIAVQAFIDFFRDRGETLFYHFGMPAVDLYNAAAVASTQAEPVACLDTCLAEFDVALNNEQRAGVHQAVALYASALQQQAALQAVEIERLKKDAARFKWLSDRFLGADFEWGEPSTQVLLIKFDGVSVWGDLGITIDAALSTQQEQK